MKYWIQSLLILGVTLLIMMLLTPGCDKPDPSSPASTARFILTSSSSSIPADGASNTLLTAYVRNADGTPADSIPITWFASIGTLSEGSSTIGSGSVSTTLTSGIDPGTCHVVAEVPTLQLRNSLDVEFTPITAGTMTLSSFPTEIPADGSSTSTIRATLYNDEGQYVPDGTEIYFTTTRGNLSANTATTSSGRAIVELTSTNIEGTATITATSGPRQASTTVRMYSTNVGYIRLKASRYSIPINGATAVLTAAVYDVNGNPVPDGTAVIFTATAGSLSPTSTTTIQGIGTSVLSSGSYPTTAAVSATAGEVSATVYIEFTQSSGEISIEPASAELGFGDQQVFKAYGGQGSSYSWRLGDASLGSLNQTTGSQVTFFAGNKSGTTSLYAEDNKGNFGTATITVTSELIITPSSVTLYKGQQQQFTVSKGLAPYTWSLSELGYGSLSNESGNSTIFTAGIFNFSTGQSSVSLLIHAFDSLGQEDTSSITITMRDIDVTPNNPQTSVGTDLVLNVAGGIKPYIWSSDNESVAYIKSFTDESAVIRAVSSGFAEITAKDSYLDYGGTTVTVYN